MSDLRNRLEESHKDLYQWFLLHQECLLIQSEDYAQQAFQIFSAYLQAHLQFENEYLLLSGCMAEVPLRWPINVYQKEHEKLEAMRLKLTAHLQHYYLLAGREKRLTLLALLNEEQTFQHVMEHHEQREEKDLFLHLPFGVNAYNVWLDINDGLAEKYAPFKEKLKSLLADS